MARFSRFDLRTTDADAARAFYASVLGHDRASIWPLHEQARARGAQPHWLGQIEVSNLPQVAAELEARGATALGPTRPTSDGGQAAVFRDPGGAIVAVGTPPVEPATLSVALHVLNTPNASHAAAMYHDLFGWDLTEQTELPAVGRIQHFAFQPGAANVGVIADITGRPGIHPHWLFFFAVDALDASLEKARRAGGKVLEPTVLPTGQRFCVCDDPQGAAFGLCQRVS